MHLTCAEKRCYLILSESFHRVLPNLFIVANLHYQPGYQPSGRGLHLGVKKTRTPKTQTAGNNKEKRFKLVSTLLSKMFYDHAMLAATAKKDREICLLRFIAIASDGYDTDLNLNNIIATLCRLFLR